jgi:FtsZ-binding cell division protein ZapB
MATVEEIINKILESKELDLLDLKDLAIKSKINPDTLRKAITLNSLSPKNVDAISKNLGVSKDFLKTGKGPIKDKTIVIESASDVSQFEQIIILLREEIEYLKKEKADDKAESRKKEADLQNQINQLLKKNFEWGDKFISLSSSMLQNQKHN